MEAVDLDDGIEPWDGYGWSRVTVRRPDELPGTRRYEPFIGPLTRAESDLLTRTLGAMSNRADA